MREDFTIPTIAERAQPIAGQLNGQKNGGKHAH
jgi:hypothetical protein